MSRSEYLAVAALLFVAASALVVRQWRRARHADEEIPAPPSGDEDATIVIDKLKPLVQQHHREGYAAGRADALKELQDATRPPIWQHRSKRRQPHHDMSQPGAPGQRLGEQRAGYPQRDQ